MVKTTTPSKEVVPLKVGEGSPSTRQILPNQIKGASTYLVTVPSRARFELTSPDSQQVISFLVTGTGTLITDALYKVMNQLTAFVALPGTPALLTAEKDCCLLQIRMDIDPEELRDLDKASFPIVTAYDNCEFYRDDIKSEKTISRTLIPPFKVPRFSMGSVQTTGPDHIQLHAHPVFDQLFFSFAENDCDLLIDGETFSFGGNCLLYIPRGSEHGIDARSGHTVHYLWLDFFERSDDMEFLVETHKPVPI